MFKINQATLKPKILVLKKEPEGPKYAYTYLVIDQYCVTSTSMKLGLLIKVEQEVHRDHLPNRWVKI